jgi:peptidoglycan-associated lipoprotein
MKVLKLMFTGFVLFAWAACGPKYPNCDKDEQCTEHGEFCVNKLCKQCKEKAHCSKQGPCAYCGPENSCVKPQGNPGDCCVSDLDCKQGKCWKEAGQETGRCAQCASDADCPQNMQCVQGSCIPKAECDSEHPCPEGMICENGKCKPKPQCTLDPVYFDFDEYAIRADMRDVLTRDYSCLKERGQNIVIEGNCDERGSDEYNLALGQRRADAVKKYLKNLGYNEKAMSTVSYGEERPVCTDHSEDCWWKNRRADVKWR